MSEYSKEIEAILSELTSLCCEGMREDQELNRERVGALVESLSVNGWQRHSDGDAALSAVLEERVRQSCAEPAMHRGAMISSMVKDVQSEFDRVSRYDESAPAAKDDRKADASTQRHPTVG